MNSKLCCGKNDNISHLLKISLYFLRVESSSLYEIIDCKRSYENKKRKTLRKTLNNILIKICVISELKLRG